MGKRVLLHTCCAPCLLYPYEVLSREGFEVVCFWYNPNIFPYEEKMRRYETLRDYCASQGIEFHAHLSMPEDFYRAIFTYTRFPTRCSRCWYLRLLVTSQWVERLNCSAFTTTLLVSKYQDPAEINRLGNEVASSRGVEYLPYDFRDGFQWAHDRAKELGLYMQKWCGCIYSFNARQRALLRRRKKKNSQGVRV